MKVTLPDGSVKELDDGATGADLAGSIGPGLARAALAIRVVDGDRPDRKDGSAYDQGRIHDLAAPLHDGDRVEIVTPSADDRDSVQLIRHDTAHVLAAAVLDLYPGTKISIGPPIEDGFYYDFEFPNGVTVSEHDFEQLEAKMREHVKADEPFVREDIPVGDALERFTRENQDYKVELIQDLVRDQGVDTVSLYTNNGFTDLCRGPHTPSTKRIKAFKLLSVAGAYWRGDADRQMLTRIYGTAFHSKEDLEAYLKRLEEARARDHRRLGRELGLFMFSELSAGSPFWHPPGKAMLNQLTELWREENSARGYREVQTPILYDVSLWKQSGHWDVYRDHMYFTDVEGHPMGLKPMNCPAHVQLYTDERRSYRDLPIRYSEEVQRCRDFGFAIYDTFGFEPRLELSTRPEKRVGAEEMWDRAEAGLEKALVDKGLEFELNPGAGAFYGPKIDLHMTDSIGRSWQLGTIQLDYYMPERFELTYTGADNAEHRAVMIHRALMGSFERFMGILIEHYAGEFPLWLSPLQAIVLPVADRHNAYGEEVVERLAAAGLR